MKTNANYFRPALGESWLLMLVIFLLCGNLILGALIGLALIPLKSLVTGPGMEAWVFLFSYLLAFVPPLIYVRARSRSLQRWAQFRQYPAYPNPPAQWGKLSPLACIGLLLLFIPALGLVLEPLTSWIPMPEKLKELFEKMSQANLPTFLAVVVAAPICEEWFLRGVALKGMLQHSQNPWGPILWTAFMFAVIHLNPWQAVPAMGIGIVLGWIYYRTRALWLCMVGHAINNGLAFGLSALFPNIDAEAGWADLIPGTAYYGVLALSIALCIAIACFVPKRLAPAPSLEMVCADAHAATDDSAGDSPAEENTDKTNVGIEQK